jgi:hypothetical protein
VSSFWSCWPRRGIDLGGGVTIDYTCCGDNAFLAKIDSAGSPRWIHSFGSYATGHVAVGPSKIVVLSQWDGYGRILTIDDAGTEIGTASPGARGGFTYWNGIALDPWGAVLVTGSFMNSLDLGSGYLTTTGGLDMDGFVARLPGAASGPGL